MCVIYIRPLTHRFILHDIFTIQPFIISVMGTNMNMVIFVTGYIKCLFHYLYQHYFRQQMPDTLHFAVDH